MSVHRVLPIAVAGTLCAIAIGAPLASGERARTAASAAATPIYLDPAYSPAERAADLVSRMTTAEKASQTISSRAPAIPRLGIRAYGQWNEALHGVSRSSLTDNANAVTLMNTTSYPIDQSMGASWDPGLVYRVASAIGDEAREVSPDNTLNLEFYSPTMNLERDPRWGRNDETYAEDPLLTSRLVSQFVDGMQGQDSNGKLLPAAGGFNKVLTTIKHYAANNSEVNRRTGSSDMDDRTLREYYTAAFRGVVQAAQPGSVMSSYNSINALSPAPTGGTSAKSPPDPNNPNGAPAAADPYLIDTLLRQTFGFKGYVTSDCDAVFEMTRSHHWTIPGWPSTLFARPVGPSTANGIGNNTERMALAQSAGEDSNCNTGFRDNFGYLNRLPEATDDEIRTLTDTYTVNDLDAAVQRLFTARIALGEFDDPNSVPWVTQARAQVPRGTWVNSDANAAVTETPQRLALAREAAEKSIVLLKNSTTTRKDGSTGKLLPLSVPSTGAPRIAVMGFPACPAVSTGTTAAVPAGAPVTSCPNNSNVYLGGYSSTQAASGQANIVPGFTGIKNAIQAINPNAVVEFWRGYTGTGSVIGSPTNTSLGTVDPAAVAAAAGYDAVVVYAGTDAATANEDTDRTALTLPGAQASLISQVAAANPNTVVYMETIGPVDVSSFEPGVSALLWSSYNGQRKGDALARVLLGQYDPSARTPSVWFQNVGQLPSVTDYGIRPAAGNPGRTYQYFSGVPAYPFGYGLSYTTFAYSPLRLDRHALTADDSFTASVDVTNTGAAAGTDVVQLYVTTPDAAPSLERPLKRLKGFETVALGAGETKTVSFTVSGRDLAFYDQNAGRWTVDPGTYGVQISRSSANADIQRQDTVSVSGTLTPTPAVVEVKPAMRGDAAREINRRTLFPEGVDVTPNLTVAMSDDTLYGYVRKELINNQRTSLSRDLPQSMTVRYASNRPDVVSVDAAGHIRTVSNGVAMLSASVTYNGVTKSTDFVIRVVSELSAITVNGRSLADLSPAIEFRPDRFSYDVVVPDGISGVPVVAAAAPNPAATVAVTQAPSVPGSATITVTGPDANIATYTVNFARAAGSDEFASGLAGPQWTWVRRSQYGGMVATPGALTIVPEAGDLTSSPVTTTNTAKNLLIQPALGDWTIESKLDFSFAPRAANQQAGIIAYEDDDNYLRVGWEFTGTPGQPQITQTIEDSRSCCYPGFAQGSGPISQSLINLPTAGILTGTTVYLRMRKQGARYTTYYSADGVDWKPVYEVGSSLRNVKVGVYAFNRAGTTNDLSVAFDYFRISGQTSPASIPPSSQDGDVTGTVPATLALSLGGPAVFEPFIPGVGRDCFASTTAQVTSSAGDAVLSIGDRSATAPGHLVNGTFALPRALQARARKSDTTGTAYNDVGSAASPLNLLSWSAPVANDPVTLEFKQSIGATDGLRTGNYSKTLTLTLSTTNP